MKRLPSVFVPFAVAIVLLLPNYAQAANTHHADGLRTLFRSFMEAMISDEAGKGNKPPLDQYIAFTENGPKESLIRKSISRLFFVLENQGLDMDEAIPDAPQDSDTAVVYIKDGRGTPLPLTLRKDSEGKWRFSDKSICQPTLTRVYAHLRNRLEKVTNLGKDSDEFNPRFVSPYRSMMTLIAGVENFAGYNLQDATQALDLSELSPPKQVTEGPNLAIMLYRVLTLESAVDVDDLPATSESSKAPTFLHRNGLGAIGMQITTDKDGLKSWKFSPETLDVVKDIYDETIADALKQGINPFLGANLTTTVRLDDFIQQHAPAMEQPVFGINLWKYLALVIVLILSPLAWRLGHKSGHIIMLWLKAKKPQLYLEDKVNSLALPMKILFLTGLWEMYAELVLDYEFFASITILCIRTAFTLSATLVGCQAVMFTSRWLADVSGSRSQGTFILVMGQMLRIVVGLIGLFQVAALFGQDSTRVLAALGIGGVALALASKNTVENIFGTIMIITSRPFANGHRIQVNNIRGVVENVGIRSTTIRTRESSLVTIPNATFITSAVDNMGKRESRRFKTLLSLTYDTPPDKLVAYVSGIKALLNENKKIKPSHRHVSVYDLGSHSIDIRINMHLDVEKKSEELALRERLILDFMILAETIGVEFAFPTQTIQTMEAPIPNHEDMGGERRANALGKEAASMVIRRHSEKDT
jgi:MscS family membrane protein